MILNYGMRNGKIICLSCEVFKCQKRKWKSISTIHAFYTTNEKKRLNYIPDCTVQNIA